MVTLKNSDGSRHILSGHIFEYYLVLEGEVVTSLVQSSRPQIEKIERSETRRLGEVLCRWTYKNVNKYVDCCVYPEAMSTATTT